MILAECFAWIPCIFGKREEEPVVGRDDIPEDLIPEIISRLPADDVRTCRRVCKKWLEYILCSTPSFVELHLRRGGISGPPSIFMQQLNDNDCTYTTKKFSSHIFDVDMVNDWYFWRKMIITKVHEQRFHDRIADLLPVVSSSCDGLLAFNFTSRGRQAYTHVCVLNPFTKELVLVEAPFIIQDPSGIYRDPLTREYKLLLSTTEDYVVYHYYTAGLETMILKKLEYSSSWYNNSAYPRRMFASGGSLHWLVGNKIESEGHICNCKIMVFNTKTEDLRVLPHPAHPGLKSICREKHYRDIEILESEGKLWVSRCSGDDGIQVWVLEDHANWVWNKRYRLIIFCENYSYRLWLPWEVQILGVHKGRVLVNLFKRGVFWYNPVNSRNAEAVLFDTFRGSILSVAFTKTLVRISPLPKFIDKDPTVLKLKLCS